MADNVTANSVTIATNDVSGVHYQKWKIADGATGGTVCAKVNPDGSLYIDERSNVSAVTTASVDISAGTSVTLQASNSARRKWTVSNTSTTKTLYGRCASGATTSNWGFFVPPGGYYELPFNYTGIITGILSAADAGATAKVQEF